MRVEFDISRFGMDGVVTAVETVLDGCCCPSSDDMAGTLDSGSAIHSDERIFELSLSLQPDSPNDKDDDRLHALLDA